MGKPLLDSDFAIVSGTLKRGVSLRGDCLETLENHWHIRDWWQR